MEARVPAVAGGGRRRGRGRPHCPSLPRRRPRRARSTSDRMPRSASARASAQPASPAPTMTTGAGAAAVAPRVDRVVSARPGPRDCRLDARAPGRRPRREARREAATRDVALAAAAGRVLDREAGAAQAVAHGARRAPRRDRRVRCGQPRHRLEQARVPHRRVARRREAVEEEGVDVGDQLRQPGVDAPKASSSSTAPPSKAMRCRLQVSGGQRRASSAASGASDASRATREGRPASAATPRSR